MHDRNRGASYIVLSAAGFATLGIFIKYAFAGGADICTMLAGRFLIAALCLWLFLRLRRIPCTVPLQTAGRLALMGAAGYGGMSLLYANGIRYLSASLTGMLLYTYPALVTLIAVALKDERLNARKTLALFICFAGLVLVLGASFGGARLAGVLSILCASVIYSLYIVVGNRILKRLDPRVTSLYVCGFAGLAYLSYGLATGGLWHRLTPGGILAILGLAVFPTLFGVLGFFAGLRLIGATDASFISMLEPFITVLLSALLLGERIGFLQSVGGVALLGGAVILQATGRGSRGETATEL